MLFLSQECPSSSFPARQLMFCARPDNTSSLEPSRFLLQVLTPTSGSPVPWTDLSHIACPFALNTCLQLLSLTAVGPPQGQGFCSSSLPLWHLAQGWTNGSRSDCVVGGRREGQEEGTWEAVGRWTEGQRGPRPGMEADVGGERGRELRGGYYLQRIPDSLSFHSQLLLCVS